MMAQLSREDIKALRSSLEFWQDDYDPKDDAEQYELFDRAMTAMDMLLAAMSSEPVGEVIERPCQGEMNIGRTYRRVKGLAEMESMPVGTKFYAAPPAPVAVPSGYALVPLKPSKDMLLAAEDERGADWQYAVDIWDSMCRVAMQNGSK